MSQQKTFLVFGATGQTGQHLVSLALEEGHKVRVLARNPAKLADRPGLEVHQGSVADASGLDDLVQGSDFVVSLLGDAEAQQHAKVNTDFVRTLVPAMRRQGVQRFLYQAGALSKAPDQRLPPHLWAIKHTVGRRFIGQHEDNAAVIQYLADEAGDVEWIVHRAAIGSDGPSKGVLDRSARSTSIATFRDCATYDYRTVMDASAIHTWDFSSYRKG